MHGQLQCWREPEDVLTYMDERTLGSNGQAAANSGHARDEFHPQRLHIKDLRATTNISTNCSPLQMPLGERFEVKESSL